MLGRNIAIRNRSVFLQDAEATLSDEDLKALLATIERMEAEITTPEQAIDLLRAEGFLDDGAPKELSLLVEPEPEKPRKRIDEMTLRDFRACCKAFFAKQGFPNA